MQRNSPFMHEEKKHSKAVAILFAREEGLCILTGLTFSDGSWQRKNDLKVAVLFIFYLK